VIRYKEIALEGAFDPLAVVSTVVESGLLTDYVVYERDGYWHVGANPLGEVKVTASCVHSRFDTSEEARPWFGAPWNEISAALARGPVREWNAYGWAAFELATRALEKAQVILAHFMIPSIELRVSKSDATIRSVDETIMRRVRDHLNQPPCPQTQRPTPVDVHAKDNSYVRGVAQAIEEIRKGRLQKVVLSRCVPVPFPVNLTATYVLGRSENMPARSFLLRLGDWHAAGFSPERIIEVNTAGIASTQPLAGTRARTGDPLTDEALCAELQADPKEIFEHATSVKLAFDELSTVGREGATRVSEFLAIKSRGSVQHLGSRVETTLAENQTAWDALGSVFPAVTASGISKRSAYELIAELEPEPRGLYGGAVLMASASGMLDAALVLRALYQRGGRTWLRAGAGIIGLSRPEREYEETCEKLRSVAPFVVAAESAAVSRAGT
jgi:salicylate synthetase